MDLDEVEPSPEETNSVAPHPEEAPYGYKADGTPYRRNISPGRRRGTGTYEGVHHRGEGRGPGRPRARNLETEIGGLLVTVNIPLMLIPALQRDALEPTEISALAKGIAQECDRNPRFRKFVEQALKVQGGTNLIGIVALIAGRRLVRHGVIPVPEEMGGQNGADTALGALIGLLGAGQQMNPNLFSMGQQATNATG